MPKKGLLRCHGRAGLARCHAVHEIPAGTLTAQKTRIYYCPRHTGQRCGTAAVDRGVVITVPVLTQILTTHLLEPRPVRPESVPVPDLVYYPPACPYIDPSPPPPRLLPPSLPADTTPNLPTPTPPPSPPPSLAMRSKPPTPTNPLDAVKQAITSKVRSKIEEKFGGPGRTLHNLQTLGGYFNNGWEVVTALLADDEGKPPSNKFGSVHSGKDTLTNVDLKPEKSTVDDDSKRIFYKAKRFQLPKFSDLFKEERPLYGEVQTLPDGQFKIPCQALKQSGNHCSRSVVVAHDPRTHGWSTIGNELCCWQHQDALAATHAQATSISQGPYQGVIDPRLSKPIKDSLYAELQKPISPADRPGFIYVYQLVSQSRPRGWQLGLSGDQDVTVRLKIGRSVDVDRRMKQWQGQCGYELYLLEFFPAPVDPTPSSKLTSTLESKLLSLPDTNFSLSTPFLESLPANLKRYLVGNLLRENPRAARLIEEAADRAAGDDDHYNERGANGSQSRTVGHHQDSAAATALRRVTHQAASKPGAMTPPDLPRCAHANKAERLIHLTLAPHRVHQEACSACGSIHKEWFETKVPRSAFVSMKDDAGQVGTGWHLDPKAWYGMEFREVIIHWLRYLQDQYGLA